MLWLMAIAGWGAAGFVTERAASWLWPGRPAWGRARAAALWPSYVCETAVEALFVLRLWAEDGSPGALRDAPRAVAESLASRESELASRDPREAVDFLWGLYRRTRRRGKGAAPASRSWTRLL